MSEAQHTPRWGMVVDLNRCVGCQTCTIACKHTNDTPPGVQWRKVLDVEQGTFPDVQREFLVTGCQHCAEPPCVPVCPSGATKQREDGLVTMDYDLCIGCAYCAVACPYQARTIVHDQEWFYGTDTAQEKAVEHPERIGVAQKCTFCVERLDEGLEAGYVPGLDLEYTPACSASCIASAIHFGDFKDPDSNVSQLVAENAAFQMHEHLGTDPQIKYLYETPAVPGRENVSEPDEEDEALADPSNPLTGELQTFWDIRAAMNFILGGMGAGLACLALLLYLQGILPGPALVHMYLGAGAFMAAGLFFVFLKIGRKLRFLNVLLRPQSSWMTRETYCVALFYPALAADWLWPQPWLHGLVALAALGFLVSQARILYLCKGIPAWRVPLMPWLLFFTGLLEGSGLVLLADIALGNPVTVSPTNLLSLPAVLGIVTGGLWIAYRITARRNGIPPLARRVIDRVSPYVTIVGHAVPVAAFLGLAGQQWGPASATVITGVAGLAAVAGGVLWKYTVITRAGYQQGFAMPWLPQRGSGERAAPYRAGAARQH